MDEVRRLTQLLLNQVSHWTQARWAAHGDAFYAALQDIAGTEHKLPRLSDLVLPDQLRVLVADFAEQEHGPAEINRAIGILSALRGTLKVSQ